MRKELELLYEANYTRYLSMFEMQELKKQMDSISSYFRKNCEKKGKETIYELRNSCQKSAFEAGFYTAMQLLTK